jgi:hypothetical protein
MRFEARVVEVVDRDTFLKSEKVPDLGAIRESL